MRYIRSVSFSAIRHCWILSAAALCLMITAFPSGIALASEDQSAKQIEGLEIITPPYSYAVPAVVKNGAVFMTLKNTSSKDLKITEAKSDVAAKVELHTHENEDGIMRMREVPHFYIPAGDKLSLSAMGDHIMLIDLNSELQPGTPFPMTLELESGAHLELSVRILKRGESP